MPSNDGQTAVASSPDPRSDVRSEVANTLIEAMRRGETPWQKPWAAVSMRPVNPTTDNAYRGVNRILLSLSGRPDNRWVTYQQAQANGWQVRKGEKGAMIVKLVEVGGGAAGSFERVAAERGVEGAAAGGRPGKKAFALRRYTVFNAQQVDGIPELDAPAEKLFDPIARAEAVIAALKARTDLAVVLGGNQACYIPALDEVRLPDKNSFHTIYDFYATAMHECAHSTMHKKRLDRSEAYGKRWGDEAYALEELTAEISSAILASETGVPMPNGKAHLDNHAGYLQSWLRALSKDPMAIFTAAKAADKVSEYMLGLEKQLAGHEEHEEWIADYERHS